MTFHLTCVHIIFSSILVAEWPPLGNSCSLFVRLVFPFLVLRAGSGSDCFSFRYVHTSYLHSMVLGGPRGRVGKVAEFQRS